MERLKGFKRNSWKKNEKETWSMAWCRSNPSNFRFISDSVSSRMSSSESATVSRIFLNSSFSDFRSRFSSPDIRRNVSIKASIISSSSDRSLRGSRLTVDEDLSSSIFFADFLIDFFCSLAVAFCFLLLRVSQFWFFVFFNL